MVVLVLRLAELTPPVFVCPDVLLVLTVLPAGGFVSDFLTTVADRRVVQVLCPAGGFVTALLVTVVFDLRVVLVLLPADCLISVDLESALLTALFSGEFTVVLLF